MKSDVVILLIAQFLKEQGLLSTLSELQSESNIKFALVPEKLAILDEVKQKNWNEVLKQLKNVALSDETLSLIHSQVILRLCRCNENETAKQIFLSSNPLEHLKLNKPLKYQNLVNAISNKGKVDEGNQKDIELICKLLDAELVELEDSKLLKIIGNSLKFEQLNQSVELEVKKLQSLSTAEANAGSNVTPTTGFSTQPKKVKLKRNIFLGENGETSATICRYAPFSTFGEQGILATGSTDGFIELWNYEEGKIESRFEYQSREEFMIHSAQIICLEFSNDGQLLASGCSSGTVKLWVVESGKCQMKIENAHPKGVTSISILTSSGKNGDVRGVVSGGSNGVLKVFGAKSGSLLNEFRAHSSFVASIQCVSTGSRPLIVSSSADGTIVVTDSRKGSTLMKLDLNGFSETKVPGTVISVRKCVLLIEKKKMRLVVCDDTPTLKFFRIEGDFENIKLLRSFKNDLKRDFDDFCLLSGGNLEETVLVAASKGRLDAFDLNSDKSKWTHLFTHGKTIASIDGLANPEVIAVASRAGPVSILSYKS